MHPQTASNNKATARVRDGAGKREAKRETKHEADEPQEECPICASYGYIPNAKTIAAIEESRAGKGKTFNTVEELMEDLEN